MNTFNLEDFDEDEDYEPHHNDIVVEVTYRIVLRATNEEGIPTPENELDIEEVQDSLTWLATSLDSPSVQEILFEGSDCLVQVVDCELLNHQIVDA